MTHNDHGAVITASKDFRWRYPLVYAVTKPSSNQVGSWTGTSSLLPRAMLILLNYMQWWWWYNCHTITFIDNWTAHPLMCCHKVQPQQPEIARHITLPHPPWVMSMLLDDMQWPWSCHHGQQGSDSNTPWYMQSQSPAPAKLVAGMALRLSFQEQC